MSSSSSVGITSVPDLHLNSPKKNHPTEFANATTRIDYVIEDIQPGICLPMLCGNVETPGHFFTILGENWNRLEDLMNDLQIYYDKTARLKVKYGNEYRNMPPFEMLEPGLPVGVKRSCDKKWHRGIIIQLFPQKHILRVYFIDYGDMEDTDIWNVQMIPKRFIDVLKAQAVRCRAFMGKNYNIKTSTGLPQYFNSGGGWTEMEGDIMRDMVYDRTLALKFNEKKIDKSGQFWLVYIHMIDESTGKVTERHVERTVLREYRGTYFSHKDDKNDDETEIQFNSVSTTAST